MLNDLMVVDRSVILVLSGKEPDSSRGGLMRLKIATKALSDHQSRLYGADGSTDTMLVNTEDPSLTYLIIKRTKTVTTVEMNEAAIKEFLSDADFYADPDFRDDFGNLGLIFERAAASVRKQIENQ